MDLRSHFIEMVLHKCAYVWRWFLNTHEVVLCIFIKFIGRAVVLHVQAMGVDTYECIAYRLSALYSIEFGMSEECRVDFRNVRPQYPDIPMIVTGHGVDNGWQ